MVDEIGAVEFADRSGIPVSPSSLHVTGFHQDEHFANKARVSTNLKILKLPLLPYSSHYVGSNASDCSYLTCGANINTWARHARSPGGILATFYHNDLRRGLQAILKVTTAIVWSGISDVMTENPGMVAYNSRFGDIAFNYIESSVAVDVFTPSPSAPLNLNIDVEKPFHAEECAKEYRYLAL